MWIFHANGTLAQIADAPAAITLDPEVADNDAVPAGTNQPIAISFKSFADGRGFSLARRLREAHGPSVTLIATGHVLPDQARHAFQSGFDQILISDKEMERFGRQAWDAALQNAVGTLYLGEASGGGIWARRHAEAPNGTTQAGAR
ncbi:MAG: DUF934 domain-containing protein [Rhizobiales bacterium]|nr:DUF934 domain-containing protein [Hyphomicrobiales bacterium]MBO6698622.1 DUF934 domain-containing protein [Hyphomicrobiales bacterium]MBO6735125.1 DUF934 domain-containing protein [Hyphomicrobiales bacterium]MBO6911068.1 DUF934 domain-containing protein [Hyphomicrobiales bacterium]MBO6957360.1 DUF934 domain-containing protein [Hyphomicrobiales bacterium]